MTDVIRSALQNTLSGREKLPLRKVLSAGMPAGSAISIWWSPSKVMRVLALLRFTDVNR